LLLDIAYERNLRDAFAAKRKFREAAESMDNVFLLVGRALLIASGAEETTLADDQMVAAVTAALPGDQATAAAYAERYAAFTEWSTELDELLYPKLMKETDAWLKRARIACRTMQASRNKKK